MLSTTLPTLETLGIARCLTENFAGDDQGLHLGRALVDLGDVDVPEVTLNGILGKFTLSELERACPGVSRDMVRQVLKTLRKEGKVKCLGKGPGAAWEKR